MLREIGRKHGNGYHDSVTQKITVKLSKGFYDLIEYEMEQLERNGNVIYERDYNSDSIARVCLRCPTSYKNGHIEYMEKQGEIFVCTRCGLIKVPKGVDYLPQEENDEKGEGKREEYQMCLKCIMYFAKEDEKGGSYYCEYCNREYEL